MFFSSNEKFLSLSKIEIMMFADIITTIESNMINRNLSKEDLSKQTGLSLRTIYGFFSFNHSPKLSTLEKILFVLNLELDFSDKTAKCIVNDQYKNIGKLNGKDIFVRVEKN